MKYKWKLLPVKLKRIWLVTEHLQRKKNRYLCTNLTKPKTPFSSTVSSSFSGAKRSYTKRHRSKPMLCTLVGSFFFNDEANLQNDHALVMRNIHVHTFQQIDPPRAGKPLYSWTGSGSRRACSERKVLLRQSGNSCNCTTASCSSYYSSCEYVLFPIEVASRWWKGSHWRSFGSNSRDDHHWEVWEDRESQTQIPRNGCVTHFG